MRMSNPYNHFDHSRDDSWAPEPQEPAAQSYAQYQESLKNPQPQQPAFDPFQQQPQAGAPAPYGQVPGAAPYPAYGMVPANSKSWVGTALLAFFLGHFGAHNFYLGYRNRAIAQLSMTVIGWLPQSSSLASSFWVPSRSGLLWTSSASCSAAVNTG